MKKVCPHCHETIDELYYSAYGGSRFICSSYSNLREYGTCQVDGSDCNSTDQNFDSCDYQCPKCEHAVEPDDLLDEVPNEEEDLEEPGQTVRNDDEDENPLMDEYGRGFDMGDNLLAACKRCKIQHVLEGHATGSHTCPKCGKTTLTSII